MRHAIAAHMTTEIMFKTRDKGRATPADASIISGSHEHSIHEKTNCVEVRMNIEVFSLCDSEVERRIMNRRASEDKVRQNASATTTTAETHMPDAAMFRQAASMPIAVKQSPTVFNIVVVISILPY
jgi:hypothetical protein